MDPKEIFDLIKLYIVNVALCLFLIIGATRLILEELKSLVKLYKKFRALLHR